MNLNERDEFTGKLATIYESANAQIDALDAARKDARRKNKLETDLSAHIAERKVIYRNAFQQVIAQLKEFPPDSLPTLAAIYFNDLSNQKQLVTSLKKRISLLHNDSLDVRERYRSSVLKRRNIEELYHQAKDKLRAAKQARRKGADATHQEHRAMKAELFIWLDSQAKFKSIEAAATAVTKQQPIAHVTARDWYKEWKKIRSASTP